MLFIPLVGVGIYFMFSKYGPQCNELDIKEVDHLLSYKLYGQEQARTDIIKFLESWDKIKIAIFYGGTGVGKTYAANLLLSDIKENAYKFTSINRKNAFKTENFGFNWCGFGYLLVDDLNIEDDSVARELYKLTLYIDVICQCKLTVVLIYNCDKVDTNLSKGCDSDYDDQLKRQFETVKFKKKIIRFNNLKQDSLEKCIQNVSAKRLSQLELNELSKDFNVTADGCKGVNSKIKYKEIKKIL